MGSSHTMQGQDTRFNRGFFSPGSIAVVGASRHEGKIGHAILSNLIKSNFQGKIYPINPGEKEILGIPCYADLDRVPVEIDLAVIVIPARSVLDILEKCGKKGVCGVIIITAGFRETGHEGLMIEKKMLDLSKTHGMRILGPNCLGVIDTLVPMNSSFAAAMPRRGKIAFMSQSGALCTSILDIAIDQDVGFSRFISLGNKADLNEIDFLEAWSEDPESRVIMAYLESIADGGRFIDVARRLTKKMPMVAIKSGTTDAGSKAVSSHTGSLAGSEKAYDTAFKQAGVIRADSIGDLFDFSVAIARQPLPHNDQVAIITNAGGPGIMTSDAIERMGLNLVALSKKTMDNLRDKLPPAASVLNPVDVLGDALADRYQIALEEVSQDPGVGAIIVILTPQFMTQVKETAEAVGAMADRMHIPIIACFMGASGTKEGVRILTSHNVPNFFIPERAVAALKSMARQWQWQQLPLPEFESFTVDRDQVSKVFKETRERGRVQIVEIEAQGILEACGIKIPPSKLCKTPEEAVDFAEKIGYPVVMKIASPDILHKTDIGGVRLNINSPSDVRDAFDLMVFRAQRYMPNVDIWGCLVQQQVRNGQEVIVGMNRDPQFGPMVMFGLGGIYVEILKDVSFRIAPFSRNEAREMIEEIHSFNLLRGVRGKAPSDIDGIVDTLLRLSQLVTEFPEIVELDINPLMVFEAGSGVKAIDMRLILSA